MCALAGPVNVMLRKMLSPDMTHQLRAAVLPLEVWAALSTGNANRSSCPHRLLDGLESFLVHMRDSASSTLIANLRFQVMSTPLELVIGLALLFPLPLSLPLPLAFPFPVGDGEREPGARISVFSLDSIACSNQQRAPRVQPP